MEATVTICSTCQHPHEGAGCPNPACRANPSIGAATLAMWDARDAKAAADRAEREMLNRARSMSFRNAF